MIDYYDRKGNPITMMEWANSFESPESKRVAATTLADGTWISTVWLGLNHQHGDGPPLIFETMVFPSEENLSEMDSARYTTEQQAIEGHEQMVAHWQSKLATKA